MRHLCYYSSGLKNKLTVFLEVMILNLNYVCRLFMNEKQPVEILLS